MGDRCEIIEGEHKGEKGTLVSHEPTRGTATVKLDSGETVHVPLVWVRLRKSKGSGDAEDSNGERLVVGDRVSISSGYGGGPGKIESIRGAFVVVNGESYHSSDVTKKSLTYVGKSDTGGNVFAVRKAAAGGVDYFRELPDPDDFRKWKGPGWYKLDSQGNIVSGPYKTEQEALES